MCRNIAETIHSAAKKLLVVLKDKSANLLNFEVSVKILIAVAVGALLFALSFKLLNDVILPNAENKWNDFADYAISQKPQLFISNLWFM